MDRALRFFEIGPCSVPQSLTESLIDTLSPLTEDTCSSSMAHARYIIHEPFLVVALLGA